MIGGLLHYCGAYANPSLDDSGHECATVHASTGIIGGEGAVGRNLSGEGVVDC